jgi:hypothetical protein
MDEQANGLLSTQRNNTANDSPVNTKMQATQAIASLTNILRTQRDYLPNEGEYIQRMIALSQCRTVLILTQQPNALQCRNNDNK